MFMLRKGLFKKSRVHLSNCQRSRHICKLSLLHDLYELNGPWQMPVAETIRICKLGGSKITGVDFPSSKMKKHVPICPLKKEHF